MNIKETLFALSSADGVGNIREASDLAYDLLKDGKSAEEKKSAENCDYLIQLLKKHSDHD